MSFILPRVGAVIVEDVEFFTGDELAPVDAGLYGPQPPENPDLLHVTHHGGDVQSLQLRVHCVQPSHQMLQEKFECLGQADKFPTLHVEGGYLFPTVGDDFAHIVVGVARHRGRATISCRPIWTLLKRRVLMIRCCLKGPSSD